MVKKFTTNCNFSGQSSPVTLYIGEPALGSHPLGFQSKWLGNARNGTIPSDIMEAFEKLRIVAEENRVSFEDLCSYVIDEINATNALQQDAKKATAISGGDNKKSRSLGGESKDDLSRVINDSASSLAQQGNAPLKNGGMNPNTPPAKAANFDKISQDIENINSQRQIRAKEKALQAGEKKTNPIRSSIPGLNSGASAEAYKTVSQAAPKDNLTKNTSQIPNLNALPRAQAPVSPSKSQVPAASKPVQEPVRNKVESQAGDLNKKPILNKMPNLTRMKEDIIAPKAATPKVADELRGGEDNV